MATASLITRSCKSWDSLVEYARCGRHPPPVILDEVQYAPGLFRHLKAAVDRERGRYGAFLLTGSQPLGLMESVSDSLAGRAAVIELEPLSFAEAKGAYPDLTAEQFLVRGGFPELYENRDIDAEGFFRSYVATYLERDLRQLCRSPACATSSASCARRRCAGSYVNCHPARSARCRSSVGLRTPIRWAKTRAPCRWGRRKLSPSGRDHRWGCWVTGRTYEAARRAARCRSQSA